jgi:hypothetical protein
MPFIPGAGVMRLMGGIWLPALAGCIGFMGPGAGPGGIVFGGGGG